MKSVIVHVGDVIKVFGQWVEVESVERDMGETVVHLKHAIVVPGIEYTRDTVMIHEIQEIAK